MRARSRNHLEQILQPLARSVLILPCDLKACPELLHLSKLRCPYGWESCAFLEQLRRRFQKRCRSSSQQVFQSKGFMGCSLQLLPGIVHKNEEKSPVLHTLSRKIGKAQSKLCPGENHANNHSARLNVLGSY